eukprot:Skav210424  [mRNA]  locus=scaffold1573:373765:381934:+ [translate_table: standard]
MVDNGIALLSKRPMTPVGELPVTGAQHAPAAQHATGLKDYWTLLSEKRDAVVQVPLARWDHELYFSKEPQKGKTYARHGGFVEASNIGSLRDGMAGPLVAPAVAQAKTTDPQQRLLLTAAYDALRGDGYDKALLQNNPLAPCTINGGCCSGVFTALSNMDWYQLVVPEAGVYTGPGVSSAIAANRISSEAEFGVRSYVFGLKGPSMTVLHGPSSFVLRSVAGMLSPDGRCKTFDATADGYIRGEGAGAILLKPAESAEEGRCLRIAEVPSLLWKE